MGMTPKYETPEELQKKIDEYINDPDKSLTITGLCYHLGFCSRQSFYDYEEKEGFSYTIKRARLFIESEYESKLTGNNATGSIFALKNFGWTDKTIQERTGPDGGPIENEMTIRFIDAPEVINEEND
jgi:hypothetical protein